MDFFNTTFWQGFLGNVLATLIGVIVGIPVAFWLNRKEEEITEKEKKGKIIRMLSTELNHNLRVLTDWQELKTNRWETSMRGAMMTDEVWNAFSDGGELQWIKDVELLGTLAETYGQIKRIKYLYESYLNVSSLKNIAQPVIQRDLWSAIDEAQGLIEEVREMIIKEVPNL